MTWTRRLRPSTTTDFGADQDVFCPAAQLLPLTYNWSNVNNTINAMSPNGATNQTVGLQWGLLSLLQQDPLNAPAASSTSSYQHVIILFADGLNTGDRWYGDFSEPELASRYADEDALRQHQSHPGSENTGKWKFTMYTVQIDTDGASQSAVLPYCASDSSKFFMLTKSGRRRLLPDRHPDRQAAGRKIGPFRSQKSPALRPGF
jgi:hypothetical protein